MHEEEKQEYRSQLGLTSSQWNTAVQLRFFYTDIRDLSELRDKAFEHMLTLIARELYSVVIRNLGLELLDKERRCMWLWDDWPPMRKYNVPANFDVIRVRPHEHYICFYDARPKLAKYHYLSRLNVLDPEDRQRFFDLRFALPRVRRRMLNHRCSRRSWSETLYGLTPDEVFSANDEERARGEEQDVEMDNAGEADEEDVTNDGDLPTTPSKMVGEAFARLNILGTAANESSLKFATTIPEDT